MSDVDSDKAMLLEAYRAMYRAMVASRAEDLGPLLDEQYCLTHMTGYQQPKGEWLAAIRSKQMRYHAAKEQSVAIEVSAANAVVVGRSVVDATIDGMRATWNLQLMTHYARENGEWKALRTVATTF